MKAAKKENKENTLSEDDFIHLGEEENEVKLELESKKYDPIFKDFFLIEKEKTMVSPSLKEELPTPISENTSTNETLIKVVDYGETYEVPASLLPKKEKVPYTSSSDRNYYAFSSAQNSTYSSESTNCYGSLYPSNKGYTSSEYESHYADAKPSKTSYTQSSNSSPYCFAY